jgi:hypothetical protein
MQRPNALLIAVEPLSAMVHGGSLPDGNVSVSVLACRNCASKVWIVLRSNDYSAICPLPTPCMFHGVSSPI